MSFDAESFELSSGLPLDGAVATIIKSEFGYRNEITPGVTFACLTFQPESGEAKEQVYSTGKGWEPGNKGATLVRSDGRKGKINDQTGYGKFIAAALKLDGVLDHLRAHDGDALAAGTWEGLKFELAAVKETTTNPTTGQSKESSKILPATFLGNGVAANGGTKAVKSPGSKTPATLPEELAANLLTLAQTFATHDEYMAAAFELDEVAGNAAAENAVMDSGKGSIWAKGQAG